jgi:signal transduction histidine kinase
MASLSSAPLAGPPGPRRAGGSIRLRLALTLIGVSILTLAIVSLLFYGFLGNYVLEQKQQTMLDHAVEVANQVETLIEVGPLRTIGTARGLAAVLRLDVQVLPEAAGITIYEGDSVLAAVGPQRTRGHLAALLLPEAQAITENGPAATTYRLEEDQHLVMAAAPTELGTGEPGLVVVTLPTSDAIADRAGMIRILLISGVLGAGFALVVGLGLGEWLGRPLRRLSRSARTMAAGSYAEPIEGSYPTEVFDLAESLEIMRREVRRSDESLRAFVASAAHELRTPLTSIQGFSQSLLDGTADSPEQRRRSAAAVFRESSRLRRLVDALLTLSRFDSREFHPAAVPVDVMRLLEEEVQQLVDAGMVERARVRLTATSAAASTHPETDQDMLRQVVGNLLRNAVQYGGVDPIQVVADVKDSSYVLDFENGGQPLDPEESQRVFERFYRGRSGLRYEGFGLGLPLVREICEVLGGEVRLMTAPRSDTAPEAQSARTRFRVAIPLLPPAKETLSLHGAVDGEDD